MCARRLQEDLVERLENELDKRTLLTGARGVLGELTRLGVEVDIAPEFERELRIVEVDAVH